MGGITSLLLMFTSFLKITGKGHVTHVTCPVTTIADLVVGEDLTTEKLLLATATRRKKEKRPEEITDKKITFYSNYCSYCSSRGAVWENVGFIRSWFEGLKLFS